MYQWELWGWGGEGVGRWGGVRRGGEAVGKQYKKVELKFSGIKSFRIMKECIIHYLALGVGVGVRTDPNPGG